MLCVWKLQINVPVRVAQKYWRSQHFLDAKTMLISPFCVCFLKFFLSFSGVNSHFTPCQIVQEILHDRELHLDEELYRLVFLITIVIELNLIYLEVK